MTPQEARWWSFDAEVTEESLILCPECKEASELKLWTEGVVDCELCGDHATMECPRCAYGFDHVYHMTFHVLPMKAVTP